MNKDRAIEIFENIRNDDNTLHFTHEEHIQALDYAIEQMEWVDVKDRLPSDKEQVLCYGEKCDGYGGVSKEYKICTYDKKADELFGRRFHTEKYYFVIAWKPLPEPYVRSDKEWY